MEAPALRGGSYRNSGGAGVFALNLNCYRSNRNRNVGFRPALASLSSEARRSRPPGRNRRQKGSVSSLVRMRETTGTPRGR
ncbi:hypothetical protein Bwad003_02960 [Bilophila wadsworthia]